MRDIVPRTRSKTVPWRAEVATRSARLSDAGLVDVIESNIACQWQATSSTVGRS